MADHQDFSIAVAILGGYLLGSIPFGLVLTWCSGAGDIRKIGSGNIGATNVLRTGRKGLAFATLLLDGGKGALAVVIADRVSGNLGLIAGGCAVLGHLFPVWLRCRGGKGVATTLGVLLAVAPPVGAAACLAWLLVSLLFRYSSLAALAAIAASPVFALAFHRPDVAVLALGLALLVVLRHHENIRRLMLGTESRIRLRRG